MTRRVIGQLRPTGTSAEVLFNPTDNKPYNIDLIIVANGSTSAVTITIYHHATGTTYDGTTEVLAPLVVLAGKTIHLDHTKGMGIADYRKAGNVAVKTSIANSVNFTAYGEIEGEIL